MQTKVTKLLSFYGCLRRSLTQQFVKKNTLWPSFRHYTTSAPTHLEHCNVGTIGHIDHGKTTLTAAITKVLSESGQSRFWDYDEIDKAPEEKARGITINACHVGYTSKKRKYAHTDCPGHIDFIKNMICGTTQMDGAILVVSAADGPMPQTYEHLALAKQIGVEHIVVYLNKADQSDKEMMELIELEIKELLDDLGFDAEATPVIPGSALCALNGERPEIGANSIHRLIEAIDSYVPVPVRDATGPFYLPVESAFTVSGRGTVAVGTLTRGTVTRHDEAELVGFGERIKTSVADVHIFGKSVPMADAGENVGLLLRNVKRTRVERGMVVGKANTVQMNDHFEAQVYVRTKDEGGRTKPITNNYIQQLFMDTFNIACCIKLDSSSVMAMPGDALTVSIILRKGMPITEGQRFMIRENYLTTLTGVVSKLLPNTTEQIAGFNTERQRTYRVEGNVSTILRKRRKK